jgi:hypothetical protein
MQRTIETRDRALSIDKIRETEYSCERYMTQIVLMKGAVEWRGKIP